MNILLEYPELEDDIKMAFQEIIHKYKFMFKKLIEGHYELYNDNCVINISYDRGDIYCFFVDPEEISEDNKYPVLSVYNYLYSDSEQDNDWYSSKVKLGKIAIIIGENLKNILTGDFSWVQGFKQKKVLLRKMIKYVTTSVNKNSLIYEKFRQDDPSWVDDLNMYVRENKIIL